MSNMSAPVGGQRQRLSLGNWTVGFSPDPARVPGRFVPATVPGAVQLDWAAAEAWPPYWQADNYRMLEWMEDMHWLYRTTLPAAAVPAGQRRHLVLLGVDYAFTVRIAGQVVHEQEGMFTRVDLDITDAAPGAPVEVAIKPAPKYPFAHRPKAQASRSCKPAVSYGWDWHPRLIPLGIWDEVYCEDRPSVHLRSAAVVYDLSADLKRVDLGTAAAVAGLDDEAAGYRLVVNLRDAGGAVVAAAEARADAQTTIQLELENPHLWWPHDQGHPYLYSLTWQLLDAQGRQVDTQARTVGFRRVRLVMNEGAWEEPSTFPKGRSVPPITLEINDRRIFARGTNWVNPEIFPGTITRETYRPLLELARDAHMNILRCWGGAIVNKDSFFELCDEMGLMVWQEFPLACNDYADDPLYLRVLDQESRAIIRRLGQHPSVCLWCGGNELFNVWSGMTDQHKALRLLNRNCLDLDPDTPFLPTSPVMGVAHGDYRFRDENGRDAFQMFRHAGATAYTEFGCPGPADVETLRSFIPAAELFPPRPGTAWEHHHAYGAWAVAPESWLFPSLIEEYFGPPETLEELVEGGQILQSEGYKALFEEARRQKPRASMALNWCWNEPWPAAANNSLVSWPAKPKAAYHAVKNALRPVMASARLPAFAHAPGDMLEVEVWLLNDAPEAVPGGRLRCQVAGGDQTIELLTWNFPAVPANQHLAGPVGRLVVPAFSSRLFEVRLSVEGRPGLDSRYVLVCRPEKARGPVRVGFNNNA